MSKYGPHAELTGEHRELGGLLHRRSAPRNGGHLDRRAADRGRSQRDRVVLTPLNKSIPPDVVKIFEEKKRAIIDGRLLPFAGPLRDNAGAAKLGAGWR